MGPRMIWSPASPAIRCRDAITSRATGTSAVRINRPNTSVPSPTAMPNTAE